MATETWRPRLGAVVDERGVAFCVWAPSAQRVDVVLDDGGAHALVREADGHFVGHVVGLGAGARYRYRLDGGAAYPDPASRAQPDGVHGASEVVDPRAYRWTDAAWRGIGPDALVIYELHVGTFTPGGTFDAAIGRLDALAALGVTAVEVMPIAAFSGTRGWGYDGVALFAPTAAYGGPAGFRRFVDAAHARGLAVLLDVVYNHLGPEGNYLHAVTGGRFFTDRHHTPWGDAVDFDGPDSGPVRAFVLENALHWAHEYHVDGLRLDATHAIHDDSPVHVLRELADRLHALARPRIVIAEDERNDRRVVLPPEQGGFGLDAVWADDLHHQLRRHTAGDAEGYFAAFSGTRRDVATTLRDGWFHDGSVERAGGAAGVSNVASHDCLRGTPATGLPPRAFVHHLQNHDQVGNRAFGDRLHHVVPMSTWRALSALLLLSPYTPMLWMGQEWAATTPFLYFTDHPDALGRLVTAGRREEFRHFSAFSDPATRARIPDPQAPETFARSKLCWVERDAMPHAGVLALYRELLAMRRAEPALRTRDRAHFAVHAPDDGGLALRRASPEGDALLLVASFVDGATVALDAHASTRPPAGRRWVSVLSTEEARFGGSEEACDDALVDVVDLPGPAAIVLRAVA